MSSLQKNNNYYIIKYYDSSREPNEKKLYFNRRKYKKNAVDEIKNHYDVLYKKGEFDPWVQKKPSINKSNLSIDEAVEKFIKAKKGDWGVSTSSVNVIVLKHFADYIGSMFVSEMSHEHINRFINRSKLKLESRKSHKTRLSTFARWLNKHEKTNIDLSEVKVFKMESNPPDVIRHFEDEELRTLISGIRQSVELDIRKGFQKQNRNSLWLCDLIWWQYITGMRIGETLRLKVSDYDPVTKEIKVGHEKAKTKAGNNVRMPIHGFRELIDIVRKYSEGKKPDDLLFGRTDVKSTNKRFKKYLKVFIPEKSHMSVHDLRHTCCIELLRRNVSPFKVMKWMRHSDIKTTMVYADALNLDLGNDISDAWNQN